MQVIPDACYILLHYIILKKHNAAHIQSFKVASTVALQIKGKGLNPVF